MRRPVFGSSVRLALAALAALFAVGIAFQGEVATGRIRSDRLVGTLGEEELPSFAVVDLVDALDHVVQASADEK